jgi:hypothetical protein
MKSSILAALIGTLALVTGVERSSAQTTLIAGDMLVSNAVDSVKEAIDTSIANMSNAIDSNTFLAIQRLRVLSRELDEIAARNIDKAFGELSSVEQKVLQDTLVALDRIDESVEGAATELNSTINNLNGLIGSIPFMDSSPRLETYGPRFIVSNSTEDSHRVKLDGYFFDFGDPRLKFAEKDCVLLSATRNSVEFECAGLPHASANSESVEVILGEVSFLEEKSLWQSFKGIFWDTDTFKSYKVALFSVPKTLGSFKVTAQVSSQVRKENARSQDYYDANSHCAGGRVKTFSFESPPGWSIDPNSISDSCTHSSKSACLGVQSVGATSFQVNVRIENNGDCGPRLPFSDTRAYYDGRGSAGGTVRWTDFIMEPTIVSVDVSSGLIEWGKDVQVSLPQGTQSFQLEIDQIDGTRIITSGNEVRKWLEVAGDTSSLSVIIRPKSAQLALQ